MPGSHADAPDGAPSAKPPFQRCATMPATSMPAITATLVDMLMIPFARAICPRPTSSGIMPYFTGPKKALTVENAASAASAPHAEPAANAQAVNAATPSEIAFSSTVIRDLECRSAMRPPKALSATNGATKTSPTSPLPPVPKTASHGAPTATAKDSTPLMTLSLAASKNCVATSDRNPRFQRPRGSPAAPALTASSPAATRAAPACRNPAPMAVRAARWRASR